MFPMVSKNLKKRHMGVWGVYGGLLASESQKCPFLGPLKDQKNGVFLDTKMPQKMLIFCAINKFPKNADF